MEKTLEELLAAVKAMTGAIEANTALLRSAIPASAQAPVVEPATTRRPRGETAAAAPAAAAETAAPRRGRPPKDAAPAKLTLDDYRAKWQDYIRAGKTEDDKNDRKLDCTDVAGFYGVDAIRDIKPEDWDESLKFLARLVAGDSINDILPAADPEV